MTRSAALLTVSALFLIAQAINPSSAHARGGRSSGRAATPGASLHVGGYPIGTSSTGASNAAAPVHVGGYPIGTSSAGVSNAAAPAHVGGYPIGTSSTGYTPTKGSTGMGVTGALGRLRRAGRTGWYGYPVIGAGQVPSELPVAPGWNTTVEPGIDNSRTTPPHTDGPSMSFGSHMKSSYSTTGVGSYPAPEFNRSILGRRLQPTEGLGPSPTAVSFDTNPSLQLTGRIRNVEKLFNEYKQAGRLGTLEEQRIGQRVSKLKDSGSAFSTESEARQKVLQPELMTEIMGIEAAIQEHR